jgi:glycine/D-amino acid oxidase-like deaminating enzyme
MARRYGTSPWIHEFPNSRVPAFPRYRGDRTADVVIVGGGLTGCAVAYACAVAGLDTVLLEQERIGRGRSGRSAGLMSPEPGPSFRDISGAYGLKAARRVFEMWRRGALDGAALIRRLGIKCQLAPREELVVAGGDDERLLRREYDARRAAGLGVAWLTRKQIQARTGLDGAGGMKSSDAFAVDPYRACIGLAVEASRRGITFFEHSAVRKVRFTRKFADVIGENGTIRTRKVIVATGTATAEFKSLQRHLDRREAYLVMTEMLPAVMRRQLGDSKIVLRDVQRPPNVISHTHDERLVVAGGDQKETPIRTRPAVLVQRTGQLMYEALRKYPVISGLQPDYGWEVVYGQTADGLMYIGPHRNYPHHVFALGGSATSVTGAFVAARLLARAVQDAAEKTDQVFGWTR